MKLDAQIIQSFQDQIWQFYILNKRSFVWRDTNNPYHIVVSEIMLQQTQTYRVEQKYEHFIETFPTFELLAKASLREVLWVWQGLGYNRRAQALHKSANLIMNEHYGQLPYSPEVLKTFPGIGKVTAASICAFAFNMPTVFIETNIRTVFLHAFFQQKEKVYDHEVIPLIEQTLDRYHPREWYYALMDYGVMLKRLYDNPSCASAHHTIQTPFQGSERQIRSMIVKSLLNTEKQTLDQILEVIDREPERVKRIINQLCKEQLIKKDKRWYRIV